MPQEIAVENRIKAKLKPFPANLMKIARKGKKLDLEWLQRQN